MPTRTLGQTLVGLDARVRALQQTERQTGLSQPAAPVSRARLMPPPGLGWAWAVVVWPWPEFKLGINRDTSRKAEGGTVGL